jgi:hypothetical protein
VVGVTLLEGEATLLVVGGVSGLLVVGVDVSLPEGDGSPQLESSRQQSSKMTSFLMTGPPFR